MESGVDQSWDVIAGWLAENAPTELALARPPAEAEDVREAVRRLGIGLPADLLAWWQRADGLEGQSSLVPPRYRPYSVRQALNRRDVWMSAWNGVMEELAARQEPPLDFAAWVAQENRAPAGSPCNSAWLPLWLPVAGDDGGNDLFVDLRPGTAHGCVREFCRDGGASAIVWWGGVADMLAELADALARRASIRGDRVRVGEGDRIWWEASEERGTRRSAGRRSSI